MTPATTADIGSRVREYIVQNFLYMRPDFSFADDDSLVTNGIVDSLGVMELISFVEENFTIAVDEADVTEKNFGSVAAIARYVMQTSSQASAPPTNVAAA